MLRLFYLCIFFVSLSHELTVENNKTAYERTDNVPLQPNKSIANGTNIVTKGQPSLVKRGTTKIKPRKGVEPDKSDEKIHQNNTLPLDSWPPEKPVSEKTDEGTPATESKKPIDTLEVTSNTTHKSTATLHDVPHYEKQDVNVTTEIVKKNNPKPTVTCAEKEAEDESMPHFPTNKTLLGMPRKIDYIVPVVITITALPLLGAAFYVIYKRGRDYWDKRHYRRMDFLIDGMYNE